MRDRGILLSLPVAVCALWVGVACANSAALLRREPDALAFLKALPREWAGTSNRDCKTYEGKNIERLAPSFAGSAAAFLKAFLAIHGNVTITSAHRTAAEQACVCIGEKGPCARKLRMVKKKKGRRLVKKSGGVSRHQLGIALDVRAGTGSDEEFTCLHEFAQLNPQFGVRFPLGKRDRPHMEPTHKPVTKIRLAALTSMVGDITPCSILRTMLTHNHVD